MKGVAFLKSKQFAIRIVKAYAYLHDDKKEFVMSRQLLKSGTSIGANLAEAECAVSRNDFLAKVYIALKETSETIYWLDLLSETGYLTEAQYRSLHTEAEEIRRILSSTTKTLRRSNPPSVTADTV